MTGPKSMSDEQFLAAFLDSSMPPAGFDHLGHMRAAWLLLQRCPLEDKLATLSPGWRLVWVSRESTTEPFPKHWFV